MALGEAPITSYFSRVKRKKNATSHSEQPVPAKRKRVAEEDTPVAPKEQAVLPFSKAPRKTKPARSTPHNTDNMLDAEPPRKKLKHTRHSSPPPSSRHASNLASSSNTQTPFLIDLTSPDPKRNGHLGKSIAFASSPPLSHVTLNSPKHNSTHLNSRQDALSSPIVSAARHRASSPPPDNVDDPVPSSQSQFFFPWESPPRKSNSSADFVGSSQSQHLSPPPVRRDDDGFVVPSSQSQGLLPVTTTTPVDKDDDDFIVPSSQSQWLLPVEGDTTTGPVDQDDDNFVVPSSQSQWLLPDTNTDAVERDGDDFVVPSSQSQWLLPVEGDRMTCPDDDDSIVPSSQSQWLLPMNKPKSIPQKDDAFVPSSQSQCLLPMEAEDLTSNDEIIPSSQSQLETELMPRSGYRPSSRDSDETTAVEASRQLPPPNLDIDVADMFEDPLPGTPVAPPEDKDDSATESDNEVLVVSTRPSEPVRQSSPEPGYSPRCGQSLPDDGCGAGTLGSSQTWASSQGSLPSAVKDFFDMVGSSDSSYPSGFPGSLRGGWNCDSTQVE
ncbi:hypothetical protein C8R45DRAFT_1206270 [Mycena sanguinolenta]|nr:hypothetical protein C8R45DRAFT_1206270 [Mycena sanguinolenta]